MSKRKQIPVWREREKIREKIHWYKREERLPKDGELTLWYFKDKDQIGVSQFMLDNSTKDKKHGPGWMVEWYDRSDIVNEQGKVEKGGFGFWPFVSHWAKIPYPEDRG